MLVSLLGLIISLGAYSFAFPNQRSRRLLLFLSIVAVHIAAGVFYWLYAQTAASDANLYWDDPYGLARRSFEPGTTFTGLFLHTIRAWLGGDFLDFFILFQSFGAVGVVLMLRSFTEVAETLNVKAPPVVYALLFLPGLHFWTAAIGKDAPVFLGISLTVWATLQIHRRYVWFGVGVVIAFLFRPHIAGMCCVALAATALFNRRIPAAAKVLLAPVAIGAVVWISAASEQAAGVPSLDARGLTDLSARTQDLGRQFGGSELTNLPFILRVMSLLFRPFFFDAGGAMGLVVSFENLLLLGVVAYMIRHFVTLVRLSPQVLFVAYSLVFSVALIFLLTLISYNVGLGLRQKMMTMPCLLLLFATLVMHRRYRAAASPRRGGAPVPRPQAGVGSVAP